MFRMFTQFHNFMEVEYLPVVMPNHNQKETAINFAERTSHAIASALNVTQTSHSYGDLMLLTKASKLKRGQPSNYMVEMAKVESMFHISSMEAVDFLEKFLSMNPDSSGRVKFLDFLRVLRLKTCALSEKIFGFIDVDRNRSVTFKQFLYASAHIMTLPSFRQACEIAYDECDVEQKGYISAHDLGVIIALAIPDLNENEIHGLFGLFDSKEDGRVSKDDFVHCLRKNPLLVALFSPVLVDKNLLDCSN